MATQTAPAPSSSSTEPHAEARSWLITLVPAAIALIVVTGLLLAGSAVVSRAIGVVSGLLTGS